MAFKWWLFIAIFLFGAGIALGLTVPANTSLVSEQLRAFEQFATFLAPLPKPFVAIFIFIKNISVILMSLILSPLLCLVPVVVLISNGLIIGLISNLVGGEKSIGYLLAGLLPHGVFEIPAFMIGEAVALSFGTAVFISLVKGRKSYIVTNVKKNLTIGS